MLRLTAPTFLGSRLRRIEGPALPGPRWCRVVFGLDGGEQAVVAVRKDLAARDLRRVGNHRVEVLVGDPLKGSSGVLSSLGLSETSEQADQSRMLISRREDAQNDRAVGTSSHRLLLAAVVGSSVLLPGIAHLRLGAVLSGLAFLLVTAVLSAIQFAAPIIEPTARAALLSSVAFALGWLVSLVAARSAARLLRTGRTSHEINRRVEAR